MESQNRYFLLGKQPSYQSVFMGAILDIYQDAECGLFAFTCYRETSKLQVYNSQPIYNTADVALQEAKKYYALINVLSDTKNIIIVYDLATDCVIGQSKLAVKLLGAIDGTAAKEIYADEGDRDSICQFLKDSLCYVTRSRFKILDKIIETEVNIKLIEIDETTKFSVEQLAWVRHFQ